MLAVQIYGVVSRIFPQYKRGDDVIEEFLLSIKNGKFKSQLHIEVRNEKIAEFDLQVGDKVTLAVSIYATEIDGNIYNKAFAWGCTKRDEKYYQNRFKKE